MKLVKYNVSGNRIRAELEDGTMIEGRYDTFIDQYMMEYTMEVSCEDTSSIDLGGVALIEKNDKCFCKHVRSLVETIWLRSVDQEDLLRAYKEIVRPKLLARIPFIKEEGISSYIIG